MWYGYGVKAASGILDNLDRRGVKYEPILPQPSNWSVAQHVAHTDSEYTKHKFSRWMSKNATSKYASKSHP